MRAFLADTSATLPMTSPSPPSIARAGPSQPVRLRPWRSTLGMPGLGVVALAAAALAQLACAAAWFAPALARVPGDFDSFTAAAPARALNEAMFTFRALPSLLASVPRDARVVAVSTLAAVQVEYYVLPRPLRLLQALPEAWLELVKQHGPEIYDEVVRRRQRLDDKGALLTPERLRVALAWGDYAVAAGPMPPEIDTLLRDLPQVAAQPGFVLYRVPR